MAMIYYIYYDKLKQPDRWVNGCLGAFVDNDFTCLQVCYVADYIHDTYPWKANEYRIDFNGDWKLLS